MRKPVRFLLPLLLVSVTLAAQTPYLVKDINPFTVNSTGSSNPYGFGRLGSRVYCWANPAPGDFGSVELWSIDGSTVIGYNLKPGQDSSNSTRFTAVNGKLLFSAAGLSLGEELWQIDAANNVSLVADIYAGSQSSAPGDRIVYHNKMLFSADDGIHGRELWISDATSAGTKLVKDLVPGVNGSAPVSFALLNDAVYFGTAGGGLWKSDGTEAGTVNVKPSLTISNVVAAGSRIFFLASGDHGVQPWVSDGTEGGTHLIAEIAPGPAHSISSVTPFGERILFIAADAEHGAELWISDGTAAGTHIVRDINAGAGGALTAGSPIAVANNMAVFAAATAAEGAELWKTDGTEGGTAIVRDVLPGSEGSAPAGIIAVSGKVFFVASNGSERTLWVTDGTESGTHQVKTSIHVAVGTSKFSSAVLTNIDGVLYFSGLTPNFGFEPWMSDGTDAGTVPMANIARNDTQPSAFPGHLTAAGELLFFTASDGTVDFTDPHADLQQSFWRTDGTPEGTVKLVDSVSGLDSTAAGNSVFFFKDSLWTSDGTPERTVPATAFVNRFPGPSFTPVIRFVSGDKLFVTNGYPVSGSHPLLWVTTTAPDAPAIPLGIEGYNFSEVAGRILFFSGTGLWSTDGTPAGTYAVVPNLVQPAPFGQAVAGGRFYFIQSNGTSTSLWRSDGTFDGTAEVKSFPTPISNLTGAGRNLFFTVGAVDMQLWVSDGTPAGTHSLPAAPLGALAATGDRVVFSATDFTYGAEPWISDGTAAGTHILFDVNAGTFGSTPTELASIAGFVYFSANDRVHGLEPWVTDGTAAGTRLVGDVETATSPGNFLVPASSSPKAFTRAGDRVYFTATTQAAGLELWAVALPSTPRLTIDDVRVAEGDAGTAMAHFTVRLSAPSSNTITVDYATSDDTAVSGSDYDSAAGTLTFAPGQTSSSFDVKVHGDVEAETNEDFVVNLRNPAGAAIEKATAFAVIDDDDQAAELSIAPDFSQLNSYRVMTTARNDGPRSATSVVVQYTSTPHDPSVLSRCSACSLSSIAPFTTADISDYSVIPTAANDQLYRTATISARQRDPQPLNNSTGWTSHKNMAMDALYLNPGTDGHVWFDALTNMAGATLGVESSNTTVLSVPSTVTMPALNGMTFVAHGLAAGTATIRVFTSTETLGTLTVDVLPAGIKQRWPGAIYPLSDTSGRFDFPLSFTIAPDGTAPYNGESATGTVTLTSKGHELGRVTLTPNAGSTSRTISFYPEDVGPTPVTISYPGDANFLPITMNLNVNVALGFVSVLAGSARSGTAATIHVRLTGSPVAAPTGTISISGAGLTSPTPGVALITTSPGVAEADVKLANVPAGPQVFTIRYSGDAHYNPDTESLRMNEAHTRAVRH